MGQDFGLTRFANSYIHQNVAQQDSGVSFKVAIGKKLGVASTNIFDKEGLKRALHSATEIAERAMPNPYFKNFASKAKYKSIKTFFDDAANITPAKRAAVVKRICDKAIKKGVIASGALSTSTSEIAIVNSKGAAVYQPLTSSSINMVVSADDSSGYAQGLSRRFDKIEFNMIADRAIEKCLRSKNPRSLEAGKYDVLLEPVAVANLFEWLTFIAFGANSYHEGTSFFKQQEGQENCFAIADNI